ncbi:MAG: family 1 glycosylhydrolase [Deltaproteobacteria bacterium]|nr:family 1 glycosylhydrolase [Deltaproteobacteria bacterium]
MPRVTPQTLPVPALLAGLLLLAQPGCRAGDDLSFAEAGPVAGEAGRGSFTFGAATAAAQIEEGNEHADWWVFTQPESEGGLGKGTFVGDAVEGYSRALEDLALIEELGLDAYRFSINWARIEPERDVIDATAVAHYGEVIDGLVAAGVKPMLTVHHFSSPIWVDDPRQSACPATETDTNLCGWDGPHVDAVIAELAELAGMLAAEYGDRVDEWCTVNEPINYLIAAYGIGQFPPGGNLLLGDIGNGNLEGTTRVIKNYLRAHVAIYEAIAANDTIDADGDGVAANIGLTLNINEWQPWGPDADDVMVVSEHPDDVRAAENVEYVYHHVFVDALVHGEFDNDLDRVREEAQPDWEGKIDFVGVQYYARIPVTGASSMLIPRVDGMICFAGLSALGGFGDECPSAGDATHWVPDMHYEYWEPGLYNILADFGSRWPDLPITVTESGLATHTGARRAEHVVRSLEQIAQARDEGIDVRGYYHWSLMDNFEWAEGYEPRFGLYTVDRSTFARTPTEGATLYAQITAAREITGEQRETYGGLGPMTPEE